MTVVTFLNQLKSLEIDKLENVKGIGPILAQNLGNFLNSDRFVAMQTEFTKLEQTDLVIELESSAQTKQTGKLSGLSICITGSFEVSRDEIKEILAKQGAKIVDAVSKNTDILIAGEKAGSKLDKAKKLNLRIVTDWQELV